MEDEKNDLSMSPKTNSPHSFCHLPKVSPRLCVVMRTLATALKYEAAITGHI